MRSDRGAVPARSARAIGAGAVDEARHLSRRRDRLRDRADGRRMTAREPVAPFKRRRSEEHTSELQSLMRISYAVFCLKKKKTDKQLKRNRTTRKENINRH